MHILLIHEHCNITLINNFGFQTSSGMFGLGASQTKCTKTFSTVPVPDIVRMNPQRLPKLVWISNKTVVHMMADGTEHKFNA